MKRLMLIFIGIFSFFSCFSMEERALNQEQQENERREGVVREAALQSVLYQMNTNFANRSLRLHQAIILYESILNNKIKENKNLYIEKTVKDYAKEDGATLDMLAFANHHGLCKLSKILIKYGALKCKLVDNQYSTPTPEEIKMALDMKSMDGSTMLYNAVSAGYKDLVRIILFYGANPNIATNSEMITPLMMATTIPSLEIVRLLLEFNADINKRDMERRTALHYTSYTNEADNIEAQKKERQLEYQAIVYELIKHGAELDARTESGETPFEYAIFVPRKYIVEIFLQLNIFNGLSSKDKEYILNKVRRSLEVHQQSKASFEQSLQGGETWLGNYQVSDLIKEEDEKITILNSVLTYDKEKSDKNEQKERTLQDFLLKDYQKNSAGNLTFSRRSGQPLRSDSTLLSILQSAELKGDRGIKRGGLKRLHSARETEDIDWIINYPRTGAQPDIQGEDNEEKLQPPKKKRRTK